MEQSDAAVAPQGNTSVTMPEPATAKLDIVDHNTESSSANRSIMDAPLPPTSLDFVNPPELSYDAPLQNGASEIGGAGASVLTTYGDLHIPPPNEVPAISALVNDPEELQPSTEPAELPPVSHILADPAVQAETSSLRSTTPQPALAPEVTEPLPETSMVKEQAPGGNAVTSDLPTAQALTPPEDPPLIKPVDTPGAVVVESRSAGELPHRSPAAPAILSDNSISTAPAIELPHSLAVEPLLPSAAAPNSEEVDQMMTDAPASPSKIARSREDEDLEEPATKRLKADEAFDSASDVKMSDATPAAAETSDPQPKVEPPIAVAPSEVAEPSATTDAPAANETTNSTEPGAGAEAQPPVITQAPIPREFNADYDKPITAPQKKAFSRIITNVKRVPQAMPFKEPVNPVALNIPTYFDVVKKPMDLSTIERKIRNNEYSTVNEFLGDFDQIVMNCEMFNGPTHGITQKGYDMRRSFDKQVAQIPSSEFVEPPPPDKKGARRTSTEAARPQRRESRSSVGNAKSPTAASPASPAFALQPSGIPVIRRDSTVGDGRPRREIHPPAPKDLPYSAQKPKKKKYQWELKFCQEIVNEFKKPKYQGSSWPFLTPVDPVAMNIPTYHKIIKKPMDLGTMEQKLKTGQYENAKEFEADMRLIFANCFKFNVSGDAVYKSGQTLERLFDDKLETKKQWIKDHAPSSSVVSPESSAEGSDNDEEEEDDDDEEEEKSREAKIAEIETQMMKMSKELQELRKGSEESKSKKARSKSGGGGGGSKARDSKKKSSKPEKKSSGGSKTKKAKDQPYVTYEQKQDISERINSLPSDRMNQALKVIRENMPNLKGAQEDEIELDIDELPNEVLHKLLNFVRKYAPRAEDPVEPKREAKPAASSKPKKNKPMGKVEQEARIKELREKLQGAASDDSGGAAAADESSGDDDDSEESEED